MSKDSNKFTLEEKTKIALEAASGDKGKLANLATKHNVTVEQIEEWMRETGIGKPTKEEELEESESVSVSASEEFANDYDYGATEDKLNYKRLFFWSIFGITVILIFIIAVFNVYEYTIQSVGQQNSESSQYYDIEEQVRNDEERLNSFGVVDMEEGIYRIPIDSAIVNMTNE